MTALAAALLEIERYVGRHGWDQPARLFALVPTHELVAAEPSLADQLLAGRDVPEDALSSIEQEDFAHGDDPLEALVRLGWPSAVAGVALAMERALLEARHEGAIPADPGEAESFVANHPDRRDVRLVVGVLRDGSRHGVARLRDHPDELVGGQDLVPGLADALARTLD